MPRALIAIGIVLALSLALRALGNASAIGGGPPDTATISEAQRGAGLAFTANVAPQDREWILAAIGKARPEARALIGEVDGVTSVNTSQGLTGAVGLTHMRMVGGDATFDVDLDIAVLNGRRTVDRDMVVLHELGHAIDFALVPSDVNAALDAGIPRTGTCVQDLAGSAGACTETPERFADTFAKWALRGSVSAVGAGYGVATPASLEEWGAPLSRLAAQLPR